jgi:hypothetical protein
MQQQKKFSLMFQAPAVAATRQLNGINLLCRRFTLARGRWPSLGPH